MSTSNITNSDLNKYFGIFLNDLGKDGATRALKKKTSTTSIIDTLKNSVQAISKNEENDIGTLLSLRDSLFQIKKREEGLNDNNSFLYRRSKWIRWFVLLFDGKNHRAKVKEARQLLCTMVEKTNEKVRKLTLDTLKQRKVAIDLEQNKKRLAAIATQPLVEKGPVKPKHFLSNLTKFFSRTYWSGSKQEQISNTQAAEAAPAPPKNLDQLQKVINRNSLSEIQKVASDSFQKMSNEKKFGSQTDLATELCYFAHLHADPLTKYLALPDEEIRAFDMTEYLVSLIERVKSPHTEKLLPLLKQFKRMNYSKNEYRNLLLNFDKKPLTEKSKPEADLNNVDKNKPFILALGMGETCLIPIGISLADDAHAVGCIIKREENGYNVKLVNSGDGIQFHSKRKVGDKLKFLPYLEFTTSAPLSEDAFRALRSVQKYNSMTEFYKEFVKGFKTVYVEKSQLKNDDFVTSQRGGSCELRRLIQMIRVMIGREAHKELMAQIKELSLNDTIEYAASRNRVNSVENELLDGLILYAEEERVKRMEKRKKPETLQTKT